VALGVTLQDQVANFVEYLSDRDLILSSTSVMLSNDSTRIGWYVRPLSGAFLLTRDHHSIENWAHWVESGAYTAMLFDGSLLQVSFDLDGEEIVGHRLAYVPCPFNDSAEVLQELPLDGVIEYYKGDAEALQLKTAIRFDYAPGDAAEGHPATHLTINNADTRIACAGPLSFERFINFIFLNFYPDLTDVISYFASLPRPGKFARTIKSDEADEIHLNWAS
jgi:hypothetical protein